MNSRPTAEDWERLLNEGYDPKRTVKVDGQYIFDLCSPFYDGITLQPPPEGLEEKARTAWEMVGESVRHVTVISATQLISFVTSFPETIRITILDHIFGGFWDGEIDPDLVRSLCPGNTLDGNPNAVISGENYLSPRQKDALRIELGKCISRTGKGGILVDAMLDPPTRYLETVLYYQICAYYSTAPEFAERLDKITELSRQGTPLSLLTEDDDAIVLVA